jgi:hypothetical protein
LSFPTARLAPVTAWQLESRRRHVSSPFAEVASGGFAGGAATIHHLPIFETGPDLGDPGEEAARVLADAYLWMLDEGPTAIRGAIVLSLVRVEREAIAADYALSDAPAAALLA